MHKKCNNGKCIVEVTDKNIVFQENRRKFKAKNDSSKTVTIFCIDDCLIQNNRQRCDYGLSFDNAFCFIELKGKNIIHALNQIIETSKHALITPYIQDKLLKAYIVPSKNNVLKLKSNPSYLKLSKIVGKDNIFIKNNEYELSI